MAYQRFMTDPDGVMSSPNFQTNLSRVFKCFYLANLPCSYQKFLTVKQMHQRVIDFLRIVADGKPWLEQVLSNIESFDQNHNYQVHKLGDVQVPLMVQKTELLRECEPMALHETIACFFMASTQ